jgi:adenylate cyclase
MLAAGHDAMLAAYRAQDWDATETALAICRGHEPRLEPLYDLYAERIAYFSLNPPGPDWDGVFVATSK